MSDKFKRRRRSAYRNVRLVPAEQAGSLPLGKAEMAASAAVLVVAAALIALIWIVTQRSVVEVRSDLRARSEQMLSNQAAVIAETVRHEMLVVDQSLKIIQSAWKQNSDSVNLAKWKDEMPALTSVTDDLFIADDKHIIQQDTLRSAIGQSIGAAYVTVPHGSLETFQSDGTKNHEALLLQGQIGSTIDARLFMMYVVRPLDHPRGWLVGASYRSAELTRLFARAGLGFDPVVALVELGHGTVQAVVGPAARHPRVDLASSPVFGLMKRTDDGVWAGQTAIDGVDRLHAFSRVKGRNMAVLVGAATKEIMAPASSFASGAYGLATAGSLLVLAVGALVLWELYTLRAHRQRLRKTERNAQELARLRADDAIAAARVAVNAVRLQVVMGAVRDGVAVVDASLRIAQWNEAFRRGVGVELRTNMPLETMLRDQITAGPPGVVADIDAEVARRIGILKSGAEDGLAQRGPGGEALLLRSLPVEEGGFMLLLSGVLQWVPPAEPAPVAEEKPSEAKAAAAAIEW